MTKQEIYITYAIFLPKMSTLNLIMRTQSNTNCGTSYKATDLDSSKMCLTGETKKEGKLFPIKGDITTKCNV